MQQGADTMDMTGRTVMITGASRGIGAAAARVFADAGANVVLLARDDAALASLAGDIGARALAIGCDVARFGDVTAAVRQCVARFGGVDVLINNAGVIEPISRLASADPEGWGASVDINLKGVFHGIRAVLPGMVAAGGGSILSVSSGAAHGPVEGWSHYCAAKAGAAMLTRCVDTEHRADGLRAIGLSPGTVATTMQREIAASGINRVSQLDWSAHIPPDWPARCLLWMCGPEADPYLGDEISLRDEGIRRMLGLTL